jgi:hypothetical protein
VETRRSEDNGRCEEKRGGGSLVVRARLGEARRFWSLLPLEFA